MDTSLDIAWALHQFDIGLRLGVDRPDRSIVPRELIGEAYGGTACANDQVARTPQNVLRRIQQFASSLSIILQERAIDILNRRKRIVRLLILLQVRAEVARRAS